MYPGNVTSEMDLRTRVPYKGMKVLNVGAGSGISGLARQLPFLEFEQLDHLDICEEFLTKAREVKWAAKGVNFILGDIRTFDRIDEYDLILLFDIVEHLPKEEGLKLLKTKPKKIVFIPIEKIFGQIGVDLEKYPSLRHLSLWTEEELKGLGFSTERLWAFHSEQVDAVWAFSQPMVSILMPAHNASMWIGKAIESCQAQTLKDWELIITDDGSTDGTKIVAKEYASCDPRIIVLEHDRNKTYPAAVNTSLRLARGKYIARLDADDWDDSRRLEISISRLQSEPVCDLVTCRGVWKYEDGREHRQPDGMVPEPFMMGESGGWPFNASIVARRIIYDMVGGFDESVPSGCDTQWNVKATLAGARWATIEQELYYYRQHNQQTSHLFADQKHRENYQGWIRAVRPIWTDPFNFNHHIELMVTGLCSRKCPHCSQAAYNQDYKDYQAPVALVEKLCKRALDNGGRYEWLQLSGGEPLLWDNLEAGCKLVKDSGAFKKIRVFTNGDPQERLLGLLRSGLIDFIYINTTNSNQETCRIVKEQFPTRSYLDPTAHKPLPTSMIPDTLPPDCHCNHLCVIENNVYPCGNFYTHIRRLGKNLEDYKNYFCTLDDDWIGFFRKINRFNMDICQSCLANGRVWPKV
jgi:glycosyltransferase involved in cell wall biosynthesis